MKRSIVQFPFGLRLKITFVAGLLISALVIAALATNLYIQRGLVEERLEARQNDLGRLIAEITSSYLFDLRVAELEIIYEDIERQPDIASIDFIDPGGLKILSGTIGGGPGSSFLEIVEDDLVAAAQETGQIAVQRGEELQRFAFPVQLDGQYLGTIRTALLRSEYDDELATVARRNLLLGLIFLAAGLTLSWLAARRLTQPLDRLVEMTDRAAAGDLDQRIDMATNDEFETLAHSFDSMLETVRRNLREIHKLAYGDELTGLSNRAWFQTAIEAAVSASQRGGRGVVLLFLDLDQFKRLNDSLGHPAGDELLLGVAQRLVACARNFGTVAAPDAAGVRDGVITVSQLGGDE